MRTRVRGRMRFQGWFGLGLLLLAMHGFLLAGQGPYDGGYGRSTLSDIGVTAGSRVHNDVFASPETETSGLRRIAAARGVNEGTNYADVDVAILDTGVDPGHPDLNVVGGVDCTHSPDGWSDGVGHGTHVAGIVGALDNGFGVVGVAPGARIWSVRVIDSTGYAEPEYIQCGLDWLSEHTDTIDVVNASMRFLDCNPYEVPVFGGGSQSVYEGGSLEECVAWNVSFGLQLREIVNAGTIFVAAAGNEAEAIRLFPALSPYIISVGALADYDGAPGGWAIAPNHDCTSYDLTWDTGTRKLTKVIDLDDSVASFSNTGADVLAPGVCVLSTVPYGYEYHSGTSMASPFVAGVAALLKERNPELNAIDAEIAITLASAECIEGVRVLDTPSTLNYTGPLDAHWKQCPVETDL